MARPHMMAVMTMMAAQRPTATAYMDLVIGLAGFGMRLVARLRLRLLTLSVLVEQRMRVLR
jgi:hypothetical protein